MCVCNVHIACTVNRYAIRIVKDCRSTCAIHIACCAASGQSAYHPSCADPADQVIPCIGYINIAININNNALGPIETCCQACAVIPAGNAAARKCGYNPGRGDLTDEVIASICYVNVTRAINSKPIRSIKACSCAGAIYITGCSRPCKYACYTRRGDLVDQVTSRNIYIA